jgi:hypothetical protein
MFIASSLVQARYFTAKTQRRTFTTETQRHGETKGQEPKVRFSVESGFVLRLPRLSLSFSKDIHRQGRKGRQGNRCIMEPAAAASL